MVLYLTYRHLDYTIGDVKSLLRKGEIIMTHKIREVYIVHHSHTDVGYTDLQEQVIYNQANNIRRAVELIENDQSSETIKKDGFKVIFKSEKECKRENLLAIYLSSLF